MEIERCVESVKASILLHYITSSRTITNNTCALLFVWLFQLRTVVLINLGSLVDLSEYFALPEQCSLHVIDSHRPCNLDNLFSAAPESEQIIVWDDGDIEEDMKEEKTAFEALQVKFGSFHVKPEIEI